MAGNAAASGVVLHQGICEEEMRKSLHIVDRFPETPCIGALYEGAVSKPRFGICIVFTLTVALRMVE